jgi:hypothetical protein
MPSDREIRKSERYSNPYPGERRRGPRFPFLADFEGIEPEGNIRIEGRVSDIGLGGCYVETINPFPEGTLLHVRIRRDKECLAASAKVVSSQIHMGMGLVFLSAETEHVTLFRKWLQELSGADSTRPDPPIPAAPNNNAAKVKADAGEALSELFVLLAHKGVLTEEERDVLLQKLHPSQTVSRISDRARHRTRT